MPYQLVIHEDNDFREDAIQTLYRLLKPSGDVREASNFERASQVILDHPDVALVVMGAAAPADRRSECDHREHRGAKRFIAGLKKSRPGVPVLVYTSEDDDVDLQDQLRAFEDTRLEILGPATDWRVSLSTFAKPMFTEALRTEGDWLEVIINLPNGNQGWWIVRRRGRIAGDKHEDFLVVEQRNLDVVGRLLVTLSPQLTTPGWDDCLSPVADALHTLLFTGHNDLLLQAIRNGMRTIKDPSHLRVVFGLEASRHGLPVEALKRDGTQTSRDQWYALTAPIVRSYSGRSGNRKPLFSDRRRSSPINCLLIAADPAGGTIDDGRWHGKFGELKLVEDEVDEIAEFLESLKGANGAAYGIGEVKCLKMSAVVGDCNDALFRELQRTPWNLIHFAGHSVLPVPGKADPSAGLVLASEPDSVCSFSVIARRLEAAEFLFVSSCQSATSAFLEKAIGETLPAILGYRWPVKDKQAKTLAVAFYKALFDRNELSFKSLDHALVAARKHAFDDYPQDATWASPLLLTNGE